MKKPLKTYILSIALALGTGALSAFITRNGIRAYESAAKPALTPPSIVFPIVWSILFLLMGISAARIFLSDAPARDNALLIYALQLMINFFWSIFFFNRTAYLFSLIWLILLWAFILWMIRLFLPIDRWAALLQIPYLLWTAFAGYLNAGVWLLNR